MSYYHRQLGVADDATRQEVVTAYRRLCMEHHPDRGGSADKMAELTTAFEEVIDAIDSVPCAKCNGKKEVIVQYGFSTMLEQCPLCNPKEK